MNYRKNLFIAKIGFLVVIIVSVIAVRWLFCLVFYLPMTESIT